MFINKANNVSVQIGHDASAIFKVCAGPNPSITWSRRTLHGIDLLPGSYSHIHIFGTRVEFDHVYINDVGIYTYTVTNTYGQIQDLLFLTVISKYKYIIMDIALCTNKKMSELKTHALKKQ